MSAADQSFENSEEFRRMVTMLELFLSEEFAVERRDEAQRDLRDDVLEGEIGVLHEGLSKAKNSRYRQFDPVIHAGAAFGLLKTRMDAAYDRYRKASPYFAQFEAAGD